MSADLHFSPPGRTHAAPRHRLAAFVRFSRRYSRCREVDAALSGEVSLHRRYLRKHGSCDAP
jgi:hypothetical protein